MATVNCTDWWARPYIKGWNEWTTNFASSDSDGYCYRGDNDYAYCFYFKTPANSNSVRFGSSTKLTITIPIIRSAWFNNSGKLYFKLLSSDPTGSSLGADLKPTSNNCDASCSWGPFYDQYVHLVSFTIKTTTLKADTGYYITVGGDCLIGIGYGPGGNHTPSTGSWKAVLEYNEYTDGSSPTIQINDNGNNSCTIQCVLGMEGNYNPMESATLCYTTDGTTPIINSNPISISPVSGTTYNKTIKIYSGPTTTVKAFILCKYKYNSRNPGAVSKAIKYYAAPRAPGKPVVSYSKNKLTNRENWTVSWSAAKAANDNSPIKGYRFRIYKKAVGATKFTTIKIYDTAGKLLSADMGTDSGVIDHRYYYDVASLSMIIDPVKHGIVPGDTIKIGLYAYAKNGVGTQLFTASQTFSDELVVQNAGIVNIKINNTWHEGQVYVKAGGAWHEAETVNVKTAAGWRESQ